MLGNKIALGPGKVDLLQLIGETGSIAEAAERMKMSYMRAWMLVEQMEECFEEPLIERQRGGAERGGARLTDAGGRVLELYQQMEEACTDAAKASWKELEKRLRRRG